MADLPRILVITDRTQVLTTIEDVVEEICEGAGCGWVLLRDRDLAAAERRALAETLRQTTSRNKTRLSVSSDVALAKEIGAEGVHLQSASDVAAARALLPDGVIGVSAHSLADVRAAHETGADYVMFSPIFPSESKPGYGPPLGLEAIREAAKIGIPVFALGGVTPASALSCIEAGAHGIAIMGTIMRAEKPAEILRDYARAVATGSRRDG